MTTYRYYDDPDFWGMQWRYRKLPSDSIAYKGEVRLNGGPWIPATTTLLHHELDLGRKEMAGEG